MKVDSSPIVVFVEGSIYFLIKEVCSPFPTPMQTITATIVSPVMVLTVCLPLTIFFLSRMMPDEINTVIVIASQ